ncbi:Metabotropic glutamate receptor 5 [Stylophora pistillata]|uniref:Metabotropic glutamate receptor 5 n=1 Tax=Stylophora pistillata TaxID=50429 RepID=A0A2B4SUF6_STYPI|nr:Metabotropic glutamate receptor 5 [Stylophora pistillata]
MSISARNFQEGTEAQCAGADIKDFCPSHTIILAVEKINNDSNLLPNIFLGQDIRNYDGNITKAGKIAYELFEDTLCASPAAGNNTKRKPIAALIGPFDSRTALYIGGVLRMFNASGKSGTTTAGELSSDSYARLYHTVPSDTFLAKVIVDIIIHFNWSYVGAIGLDNLYGRSGWSGVEDLKWNCPGLRQVSDNSKSEQHHSNVVDKICSSYVPYIIDAVYSAAHALDILTRDLNGIDASDLQQFEFNIQDM